MSMVSMAFSRKLDKRDFRKQWNTFSPNQLRNTGDDLPPPAKNEDHTSSTSRGGEFEGWGAENLAIYANQGLFGL
jgi:hypothetical protein